MVADGIWATLVGLTGTTVEDLAAFGPVKHVPGTTEALVRIGPSIRALTAHGTRTRAAVINVGALDPISRPSGRALVASEAARTPTIECGRRVVALDVWVLEARAVSTSVEVCTARAVPSVPLVARARVPTRTVVVARCVAVAVVGLDAVAVEHLCAVHSVAEHIPVPTLTAVRVGPHVRAHTMLRARVVDAVVHIRAHLTVADETRRALVAPESSPRSRVIMAHRSLETRVCGATVELCTVRHTPKQHTPCVSTLWFTACFLRCA